MPKTILQLQKGKETYIDFIKAYVAANEANRQTDSSVCLFGPGGEPLSSQDLQKVPRFKSIDKVTKQQ